MSFIGYATDFPHSFIILTDKLSHSWNSLEHKFLLIAKMSSSFMFKERRDFSAPTQI